MIKNNYTKIEPQIEEKFQEIERNIPERIDTSQFKLLSSRELVEILGLTIKKDEEKRVHWR